jgi:peptide/nickel transport system substrate-binding protein
VQEFIYGRGAMATANFLNNPPRFRSSNMKFEFNIDKANQILEAAGWKKGADGIRAKGNVKLKFVFQTSVSGQPRQKCQAIIKDACTKAGIDLELKSVTARCSSAATRPTRTPTRSSGPTSRCTPPP